MPKTTIQKPLKPYPDFLLFATPSKPSAVEEGDQVAVNHIMGHVDASMAAT